MLGLLQLLLAGLALLWLACVGYVIWGLTHPPRRTYASAVAKGMAGDPSELDEPRSFETWTVQLARSAAEVWSVAGDRADGPVILLVHGWGDSRIGGLVRLPRLARHASRLILLDLPGHGSTPGICRLGTREVEDTLRVIDRVASAYPDARLVLYGWSLGAGVAIAAASRAERVAGVIAEAPYRDPWTPARNVMREAGVPWRTNLAPALGLLGVRFGVGPRWKGFDRAELAGRLAQTPLLVVHGEMDTICPIEHGQAISDGASNAEFAPIEGAGHNNLWTEPEFVERINRAIDPWVSQVT